MVRGKFVDAGVAAGTAAVVAGQGTISLIGYLGTASTGTAISGLSGAAAWSATLAWLGGGSLATGGGGMALGGSVLGGVMAGPAVMAFGFVLAGQGEKALTQAKEYEAQGNTEIPKVETASDFMVCEKRQIQELYKLVIRLKVRATAILNELDSLSDENIDLAKVKQVDLLVQALSEILPILVLEEAEQDITESARLQQYENKTSEHPTLEELIAKRPTLISDLNRSFDDRQEQFYGLLDDVDREIDSGNNQELARVLSSITAKAKASPFNDLVNLS